MNWRFFIALVVAGLFFCGGSLFADDSYVHAFTGFTFPPKVGAFEKVKVTQFNDAHSDIEVDYNNKPFTVHLSVYVYPANAPLKDHYEECKAAVIRTEASAKLLSEKSITLEKSGSKYDGYSAVFAFRAKFVGNEEQDLLSQLILFQRGDYYVLFRISYAASDKASAETEITDFIDKLAWPAGDGTAKPPGNAVRAHGTDSL